MLYNVRVEEEEFWGRSHGEEQGWGPSHEAFHLHVELQDLDLDSAHLFICAR